MSSLTRSCRSWFSAKSNVHSHIRPTTTKKRRMYPKLMGEISTSRSCFITRTMPIGAMKANQIHIDSSPIASNFIFSLSLDPRRYGNIQAPSRPNIAPVPILAPNKPSINPSHLRYASSKDPGDRTVANSSVNDREAKKIGCLKYIFHPSKNSRNGFFRTPLLLIRPLTLTPAVERAGTAAYTHEMHIHSGTADKVLYMNTTKDPHRMRTTESVPKYCRVMPNAIGAKNLQDKSMIRRRVFKRVSR
mmetsp:Transcript_13235/g.24000  ORF Transcript_13235/g.24000 Transcript_13235/m.24000 type:complete len:246 (+) Transcript_13235:585-1322(+)